MFPYRTAKLARMSRDSVFQQTASFELVDGSSRAQPESCREVPGIARLAGSQKLCV